MRRADRLFQIVQHLRARRLTTAAQLARWLEVSERTVYRDIRDLSVSGVPVEGEAGVGYRLDRRFDLTPIMFTRDEVEAVVAGLRMAQTFAGPTLAKAAISALDKVSLALPPERREEIELPRLFAPGFHVNTEIGLRIDVLRNAIATRRKLHLFYTNERKEKTCRTLCPLALYFWGSAWTLAAWCELRQDFRNFRLDRIEQFSVTDEIFSEGEGKSLQDFLRHVASQ